MFRDNFVPVGPNGTVSLPLGADSASGYYSSDDARLVQSGMRSVEVYFRMPSSWPSGVRAIVADGAGSAGVYVGITASGQISVSVGSSTYTSASMALNGAYHVVVTASVNDAVVYINGVAYTLDTPTSYHVDAPFSVGGSAAGGFPGVVYFCRVYNTWLSEDYVSALYAAARGVSLNASTSVPDSLLYAPCIATSNLVTGKTILGSGWSLSGGNYVVNAATGVSGGLGLSGDFPHNGTLRFRCKVVDYVSGGLKVTEAETASVLYPDSDGNIDFTFRLTHFTSSGRIQLLSYSGEAANFKVVADSISIEYTAASATDFDSVSWGSYPGFVGTSTYSNGAVRLTFTSASESVTPFLPLVNVEDTAAYAKPGVMNRMSCTVRVISGTPRLSIFGLQDGNSQTFSTHTGLTLSAGSVQTISGVVLPTGSSAAQWGLSFAVGPSDSAWVVDVYNPTLEIVGLVGDYSVLSPTSTAWPDSFNGLDLEAVSSPSPNIVSLHGVNKTWVQDSPAQYSAVATVFSMSKPLYIYSQGNYYPVDRSGSITLTTTTGAPIRTASISITNPAVQGISRMAVGRDAIVPTHLGVSMLPSTYYSSSSEALKFEGDKTVVLLFRTGSTVPAEMYLLNTGVGAGDILVAWSEGSLTVIMHGGVMASQSGALSANTLYELVICKGSNTDSPVYLNGTVLPSQAGTSTVDAIGDFYLGGYNLATGSGFSGTMFSAAVASVKLSSSQVSSLWNGGDPHSVDMRTVITSGLVSYWRPGGLSAGDKSWRDCMEADVTLTPSGGVTVLD